jgi:hypothetical protein
MVLLRAVFESLRGARNRGRARANKRVPLAPAIEAKIFELKLCPPMALWLLSRASGDFGTSPFLSSSRASHCSPASMYVGCGDQSAIARREINSRLGGMASTYARLMSPPGGESFVGLQSVRFNSELHGRVRVVCLFCTREPSCSHLAPCGLFVSAPGTRHASALGGMAPKFFRWIHGGYLVEGAHVLGGQVQGSFAVPAFIKKRHAAAQQCSCRCFSQRSQSPAVSVEMTARLKVAEIRIEGPQPAGAA